MLIRTCFISIAFVRLTQRLQNLVGQSAVDCCISEHGSSIPNLLVSDGYELLRGTLFFATKNN